MKELIFAFSNFAKAPNKKRQATQKWWPLTPDSMRAAFNETFDVHFIGKYVSED